jgi:hypothetical protein
MGGERASTIRRREAGEICAKCGRTLPPPPPEHRPGYFTGERHCANCLPRPHTIHCNVQKKDWSVTFTEADYKTSIGPWLICDSHEEVLKVLVWGHISGPDLDKHYRNMERWGVGGGDLHLTSRERHQLIERRRGWPWNGYELLKMKAAGNYPPQRLTAAQEERFLRNRRNR